MTTNKIKFILFHFLIYVPVALFVLNGCATVNKIFPKPEPTEEEKPFVLRSDPNEKGLLILSVHVILDPSFDIFKDNLVDEGFSKLLGTGKKTGWIKSLKVKNEEGQEFSSRLFNSKHSTIHGPDDIFMVFDGLPQGLYKLSDATAEFGLSNKERKDYFDCEYHENTYPRDFKQERESHNCPYRAYVSYGLRESADSAVGSIQVINGKIKYVGLLTIMENHRIPDYYDERRKINGEWQDILVHGHSIEKILKSESKQGAEEQAIHVLASDNQDSNWKTILQGLDKHQSK